ncbi:EAL domain-containing protein [Paraburkholderia sp. JHI869]|uniref:EAL and HDOD domain-containing protein n=1 Tax=Paraburkholderia sp. JHI869 TaxID=3112959 RepID=UPI00316F6176
MTDSVFLARQPIVDRSGAVVAQELLFRDSTPCNSNVVDGFARTAAVIERTLGDLGVDTVLADTDGAINCTGDFLHSDFLAMLPPERFILEVLEDTELTPELGMRCAELRRTGFRIALDDVRSITPALIGFLPHVDMVKLDWPFLRQGELADLVSYFKQQKKLVLAEKIEERTEHEAALKLGCDLFQGYFFARPQLIAAKKMPPAFAAVFQVLNLLINDATTGQLESSLKSTPSLVVQILRLANSSGYSRSSIQPITSIGQAVSRVGTQQLVRWCCILLYGNGSAGPEKIDPLLQLVQRRATFMERVGKALGMDTEFCQAAYLTGMLSLAHIPNGLPLDMLVSSLPLSDDIRQGITYHSGPLGTLLFISEKLERGEALDVRPEYEVFGAEVNARLIPMFWQA